MSGKGLDKLAPLVLWMYCNLLCINIWSTGWCGIWETLGNSWSTLTLHVSVSEIRKSHLRWNVLIEYSNIFIPTLTVCFHSLFHFPKAVLFHFFIQIWDTSVCEILASSFELPSLLFYQNVLKRKIKKIIWNDLCDSVSTGTIRNPNGAVHIEKHTK